MRVLVVFLQFCLVEVLVLGRRPGCWRNWWPADICCLIAVFYYEFTQFCWVVVSVGKSVVGDGVGNHMNPMSKVPNLVTVFLKVARACLVICDGD